MTRYQFFLILSFRVMLFTSFGAWVFYETVIYKSLTPPKRKHIILCPTISSLEERYPWITIDENSWDDIAYEEVT